MVKKKFPEVHLIANTENVGFSKANNQAMRIAKGKYHLLLNPDTVVEEDTFEKTIAFMDAHPDCGGLGVKMIDGKGNFLPESKRGLPTPKVAFYKIFGLSTLFPKSKRFGQYHLGYLPMDETNPIEVLSGAYMMMRKETLDKVGLLDEAFFMYGEDIDLSYRITLGGYKNYYFPETSIIHYKGESTKKSSVNYVFVFYNAMIIFAKKHFSEKNAKTFSTLINLAIYLRAGVAIFNRFIKKITFPLIDFSLALVAIYGITISYQTVKPVAYNFDLLKWILPVYSFIWVISTVLFGGYDKPVKLLKTVKGALAGGALLLIGYALLPKEFQFSRFIVLIGTASTLLLMVLTRVLANFFKIAGYVLEDSSKKRFVLIGDEEESERILALLKQTTSIHHFGLIYPDLDKKKPENFDGHINQLADYIHINKIDEVIFAAKNLSSQEIIRQMSLIKTNNSVDYKIAQPDSLYLIGSNSIHTAGDIYLLDLNSITTAQNKRNKRIVDVCSSLILLTLSPIAIWFQKNPIRFFKNIFLTIVGRKTWVGYNQLDSGPQHGLPKLKPNIHPLIHSSQVDISILRKTNLIYAKDYKITKDLKVIYINFRQLGS
jgi:GT2 family glycosyltransferase